MSRFAWLITSLVLLCAVVACSRVESTPTMGIPSATSGPTITARATASATVASPSPTPAPPTPSPTVAFTPTSTPTPEPVCLVPDPPPTPIPPDASVTADVGGTVQLAASELFGSVAAGEWHQQFMEAKSLSYMSNWRVELTAVSSDTVSFTPQYPGVYRFMYGDGGPVVDVEVHGTLGSRLEVRGIAFADLFGEMGGPEFNLDPDDPTCQATVFNNGFSVAGRVNANLAQFTPASFLQQVSPYPVFKPQTNGQSLTDDVYYADLLAAAEQHGLEVSHAEQTATGVDLPEGDWQRRAEEETRSDWWDAWFAYWQSFSVEMATRAAADGADMYVPFIWADETFKDPNYDQHWRDLIAAVREVFPGKIALAISNWATGQPLSFADALDVLIVGVHGSYYPVAQAGGPSPVIQDRENPTMEQLAIINDDLMARAHATAGNDLPVYFMFAATSSNGQKGSEIQGERDTFITDFAEQVMYYEAFFAAVSKQPWIKGMIISGMDWFDQYERPPDQWYFDATNEDSPRSKPAEQVLRAWWAPEG